MSVHSPHFPVAIAVAIIVAATSPCAAGPDAASPSVKITSPLGRMGTSAKVRIVAQIHAAPETTLKPIRFYVDGCCSAPMKTVRRTRWSGSMRIRTSDAKSRSRSRTSSVTSARDPVELKPFEIVEVTGVSRVLLEASVYDKIGRFVSGLGPSSFTVTEDGVPQEIDLVSQETLPATFALLIDSSQSMSRRIDFVRDASRRFVEFLRPRIRCWSRRSRAAGRCNGTHRRPQNDPRGRRPRRIGRRYRDSRQPGRSVQETAHRPGSVARSF